MKTVCLMHALGSVKVLFTKGWQQIHKVMTLPGTGGHLGPYGVDLQEVSPVTSPAQRPANCHKKCSLRALRIGLQACMAPVELQHFSPHESSLAASLFNLDYFCIIEKERNVSV